VQAVERVWRQRSRSAISGPTIPGGSSRLADFLKVDNQNVYAGRCGGTVRRPRPQLIAKKLRREKISSSARLEVSFFEGYFFRKPEMMRARARNPIARCTCDAGAISKPNLTGDELRNRQVRSHALHRLLRYLNSAHFRFAGRGQNRRPALTSWAKGDTRWCHLSGMLELSRNSVRLALAALVSRAASRN